MAASRTRALTTSVTSSVTHTGASGTDLADRLDQAGRILMAYMKRTGKQITRLPGDVFDRDLNTTQTTKASETNGSNVTYLNSGTAYRYETGGRHPLNYPNQQERDGHAQSWGPRHTVPARRPFMAAAAEAAAEDIYAALEGVIDDWLEEDGWDAHD